MIGVVGQFVAYISLGEKRDFIKQEDLAELTIIESAGNCLPEFILAFSSNDESIQSMLHEGYPINVSYGRDSEHLKETLLYTGKMTVTKEGESHRAYHLVGLCCTQKYVTKHNISVSEMVSGVETVLAIAGQSFNKVTSNITKSKDKQYWIQPNISDKQFVNKTLMHSDLGDSFPMCAITADGEFILKDGLKAVTDAKANWRFTRKKGKPTDIVYGGTSAVSSSSLFVNSWTGYEKVTHVLNLDTGKIEKISTKFTPKLAMSKDSDRSSDISGRFNGFLPQSDNVHANYRKAFDHNIVHLSQLSKIEATAVVMDEFVEVKPLDTVMFLDDGVKEGQVGEHHSGHYFITRVSRSIQSKVFGTTVFLNRESVNSLKNKA